MPIDKAFLDANKASWDECKTLARSTEGWTKVSEGEGAVLQSQPHPGSPILLFRATGKIKHSAKDVIDILWKWRGQEWKDFTGDIHEWDLVQDEGDSRVLYQVNSVPWPLAKRDMVMSVVKYLEDDGITGINFKSVVDSRRPPDPKNKIVRAEVVVCPYLFLPNEGGSGCTAVRMLQVDPKGNIPKSIVNMQSKGVRDVIKKLNAIPG